MKINELRTLFPVTKRLIHLNHCGVSPVSSLVKDAMLSEVEDMMNQGAIEIRKWYHLGNVFKRKFAEFIGARSGEIAITLNTSDGINIIANGLDWNPGDNVVLPGIEYPANVYPWMNLASRDVEVRFVPDLKGTYPPEQFDQYIDHRTRIVATSFVQFSTGYVVDLENLGKLCRERGVLFVVDAIQGLGVLPLNVERMQIDFLSASTYKWMLGPQGVGLFYINRRHLDTIVPRWVGATSVINAVDYLNYDFTFEPSAKRFEIGTFNTAGVIGAAAALDLIVDLGLEFIQNRIFELTEAIYQGVQSKGYEVFSSWEIEERSGIISFSKQGVDPDETQRFLLGHDIASTVRGDRLRFAPHCYNTLEEMERAVKLLP